jgi:hypothetical protein
MAFKPAGLASSLMCGCTSCNQAAASSNRWRELSRDQGREVPHSRMGIPIGALT